MADPARLHVLIIDDDEDTRSNLRDILELDGHEADTAGSIAEAMARGNWCRYGAVLLDRRLPDGLAEEILPQLRRLAPQAGIIVVTGHADLDNTIAALRLGAADYILKPINAESLRASLVRLAQRQQLEQAKRRSEDAFRTLVEAAPCLITIFRPDETVLYFSPFAEKLTGFSQTEIVGKQYTLLAPDQATKDALWHHTQEILAGGASPSLESSVVCKDGTRRWLLWNAQLLSDYENAPAILGVGQDISEVKEAQTRALQAERLAAIGQMVTGLAHESGNALARSQACLEMLALEVEGNAEALDLIQRAQKAQDHLRQLYEEVRGYAAPVKLELELWDVSGIWRQAWSNLAVARQGRDASLKECTVGASLECEVDQFRLEQVFRNLFENALAACKDPVIIQVQCANTTIDERAALAIAVRDNGPGLSAEQKNRIFEPFFTTKTKGTGLGMAIAKRIVEAHGGRIAVGGHCSDGAGGGAEIVITLPRKNYE